MIPPVYVMKSGKIDIADICTAGNPLSFGTLMSKTRTAEFCFTVITQSIVLDEEVNLPQMDNIKWSKWKLYAHSDE